MKYKIVYSVLASSDLTEIWEYICFGLNNRYAANRILDSIRHSIEKLPLFPMMGSSLNSIAAEKSDYRFLVCGKYIVIYTLSNDKIIIERVFYGKRDYLSELFNENITGGE